jgi:methionyl-tRNA formyltransferase
MKNFKVAYFGTNDFSAYFLEKLLHDTTLPIKVEVVVTQPDKPVGRKQIITPVPVKQTALKHNIPVYDGPVGTVAGKLKNYEIDIALLYSYGEIIPDELLQAPKIGFWNIHPSLLPLYRNVAPMAYTLMLGDEETGTTLIKLDDKLDHGPILAQKKYKIEANDRRPDLERKLADLSFDMFAEIITEMAKNGQIPALHEQDHEKRTFTRMFNKNDGFVPFPTLKKMLNNEPLQDSEFPQIMQEYWKKYRKPASQPNSGHILYNHFRAMFPWPGLWTLVNINNQEKRLKLVDMKMEDGKCILTDVQLEGKNPVDLGTFNRAYQIF